MKIALAILLNIVLGYISQLFLPWWIITIVAALVAMAMMNKAWPAFIAGFLSYFLLWSVYSYILSSGNDHLLAGKMGQLFGNISHVGLFLLSGLIAGIFGGLGSLVGWSAKKINST